VRAVVTRISRGQVRVNGAVVGEIEMGLCALVGVGHDDTTQDAVWLSNKLATCRVFGDPEDKMNLSVQDVGGSVLAISQFTLYGDMRKGRRPSFADAIEPSQAEPLFNTFCAHLRDQHGLPVQLGRFGANMQVETVNEGPVTLLLDSKKQF